MRFTVLAYFPFLLVSLQVLAVDKSNFKLCEQSGFCKWQRGYTPETSPLSADFESVKFNYTTFRITILSRFAGKFYLDISLLKGIFHLRLDELNPIKPRYRIPPGYSVLENIQLENIKLKQNLDERVITLEDSIGNRLVLYCDPLLIDIYSGEVLLFRINERSRLNIEHLREKTEENKDDENAWEETFKGHTDSKPNGPSSVGLDVTMVGFKHAFGLAEHSDTHKLKDTTSDEPYRLYNLDVFQYELDSRMALYGSVPLMWGSNARNTVGIFWNNPSETWVDLSYSTEREEVQTHWMSESGIIDVYFLLSSSPKAAFKQYSILTGVTPLPPLFALAYHQCRWNYNDEEDLLSVHKQFDKYVIPYDVIWLDIEHTDGKRYFTWDKQAFPDPKGMVETLAQTSRRLVTVIDPHLKRDEDWSLYNEAVSLDLLIKKADGQTVFNGHCWPGNSVYPDFMNPKTCRWWSNQFLPYTSGFLPDRVFTWNDMNEPSVFSGPEVTMVKDAIHHGGWEHRDIHNLFGFQVHRSTWEGQLFRSRSKKRPFVLTRAFFAGSQRFGSVWTGDNDAHWDHLKAAIPMVNSLSLCGITHAGADVGGFFGDPSPELLTRWYQLGAYQPFFRAHAHIDSKRREPWLLEKKYVDVIRLAIEDRYRLLPYWYHQFFKAELEKLPVVSSLWFHFPHDDIAYAVEDQFMVGDAILVKPVQHPDANSIEVYLPGGTWYQQGTWKQFSGGTTHLIPVTLADIPVFYRGGYIVPMKYRVRRSSALMAKDPYTLIVALDQHGKAEGEIYIDDEDSYEYRDNENYRLIKMSANESSLVISPFHTIYEANNEVERIILLGLHEVPVSVKNRNTAQNVEFRKVAEGDSVWLRKPEVNVGENFRLDLIFENSRPRHGEL